MSEAKHTPGPWDCWDMDESGWHVFATKFNRDGRRAQDCRLSIAQVRSGRSHVDNADNYFEGVANARLIAAAPDLLDALKKCISTFEQLADAGNYPLPLYNNGGWKFAADAIAKAEGSADRGG